MAIIMPAHLRNATGGQLKEIARNGYSQSGLFLEENLNKYIRTDAYVSDLTCKHEGLGKVMSTLEQNKKDIEASTEAVRMASHYLVDTCKKATDNMIDSGRKMRDSTEKVGVALQKFTSIATASNLSKIADDAARLADSMERLAALESTGQLQKLIAAMSVK